MRWRRIKELDNETAITNGNHLTSLYGGTPYKHGTHFICKTGKEPDDRYTLWEGDKMIAVFKSAAEAKGAVNG